MAAGREHEVPGDLAERLDAHVHRLCDEFPDRHVGGPGNRAATELFARVASAHGFDVTRSEMDCIEWERGESELLLEGGDRVELNTGPYSLPADAEAPLAAVASLEELERGSYADSVLLLHGEIASGQLMPKNFVFYNPDEHRRIIAALERHSPRAVIAATGRDPELAGGPYPFPLIEDGDFDIPNAYITDVQGEGLLSHVGESVTVRIRSQRIPARAEHLVATKGPGGQGRRVVYMAHVDSKDGTPGALDNASGVAVLLGLAELVGEDDRGRRVELLPLNGEDYYAASGQMRFLSENQGRLGEIELGLNVDGAGFVGQRTAVSLYGCPAPLAERLRVLIERHGFIEGPQWPQGDHSILTANGVPAVAVTSENAFFIASTVAHTAEDTPDRVDPQALAQVSRFFADVLDVLG